MRADPLENAEKHVSYFKKYLEEFMNPLNIRSRKFVLLPFTKFFFLCSDALFL